MRTQALALNEFLNYFLPLPELGAGGLFPLPFPEGLPVVLGPLGGLETLFAIPIFYAAIIMRSFYKTNDRVSEINFSAEK